MRVLENFIKKLTFKGIHFYYEPCHAVTFSFERISFLLLIPTRFKVIITQEFCLPI